MTKTCSERSTFQYDVHIIVFTVNFEDLKLSYVSWWISECVTFDVTLERLDT